MPLKRPGSSRALVRAHRARMRALGRRPIQLWTPDPRSTDFPAEGPARSREAARSRQARANQAFLDAIWWGVKD